MLRTLASRCGTASRRFLASRVVNIGSIEAYDKLSTTGDLLVTNFTASWCGPCQVWLGAEMNLNLIWWRRWRLHETDAVDVAVRE